jgi:phage baseplate assembly protein gpV
VFVVAPYGDVDAAVAIPSLYNDTHPAPAASADTHLTLFADGTAISYNHATHALTADVKGTATLITTGDATATIGGNLAATVAGNVQAQITGNLDTTVTGATTATLTGPATLTAAAALTVNATGVVTITAAAAVSLTAATVAITAPAFSITGNLSVTGNITATGTVAAGNPPVSLTTHTHSRQAPPDAPS